MICPKCNYEYRPKDPEAYDELVNSCGPFFRGPQVSKPVEGLVNYFDTYACPRCKVVFVEYYN